MRDSSQNDFLSALKPGQLQTELFSVIPNLSYFVKDRQGKFIDCDDDFLQMMGVQQKSDLIGKTDEDLITSDLAKDFMQDDQQVMNTGEAMINNLELAPNNDLMPDWRMTSKIPLYDCSNRIIGLAGITRLIRSGDILLGMPKDTSQAVQFITKHFAENITVKQIASATHMSVSTLERRFNDFFSTTPQKYLRKVRVNAACRMIREGGKSMSEIAHECGFYDQSSMTKEFKSRLQMTPLQYAKHSKTL